MHADRDVVVATQLPAHMFDLLGFRSKCLLSRAFPHATALPDRVQERYDLRTKARSTRANIDSDVAAVK